MPLKLEEAGPDTEDDVTSIPSQASPHQLANFYKSKGSLGLRGALRLPSIHRQWQVVGDRKRMNSKRGGKDRRQELISRP